MKVYGIADAYGLESFRVAPYNVETGQPKFDEKELSMMVLRANANRTRHAVVYMADINGTTAKGIQELYKKGDYIEALNKLKEEAITVSLARGPGVEKSWRLIPNPDLDIFSN